MASYKEFNKDLLYKELMRRGIEYDSDANKDDLVVLLEESDGHDAERPTVYAFSDYDPTSEERDADLLMGYRTALQAVEGQKKIGGNNPQYDPVIEALKEDIEDLEAEIAQRQEEAAGDGS